jgi:hypothetical protein
MDDPARKGKNGGHPLPLIPEHIPSELRERPQWVNWKREPRDNGRWGKIPFDARTGHMASTTDPSTWAPFDVAVQQLRGPGGYDGPGFVFVPEDPFVGIDLDDCRDHETGKVEPWALKIADDLGTYTEVSPSGTGLKLFCLGELPGSGLHAGNVELYDRGRFFAVTGNKLPGFPSDVRDCQQALTDLYLTHKARREKPLEGESRSWGQAAAPVALSDDELIRRATAHPAYGARLSALLHGDTLDHKSPSEADYELARLLGFWCGGDVDRVISIMRAYGTFRKKWYRKDYLPRTVAEAASRLSKVYDPTLRQAPPPYNPPVKIQECATSCTPGPRQSKRDRELDLLVEHVHKLCRIHNRAVGLSVRHAAEAVEIPPRTAARRLKKLVKDGRLIEVSKGFWDKKAGKPGNASVYNLPEFVLPQEHVPPQDSKSKGLPLPPPYTQTPGGLLAVWWHRPLQDKWFHFGDCNGQDAADALAGRLMADRPGLWSVGDELRRYARGRCLRVIPWNRAQANKYPHAKSAWRQ